MSGGTKRLDKDRARNRRQPIYSSDGGNVCTRPPYRESPPPRKNKTPGRPGTHSVSSTRPWGCSRKGCMKDFKKKGRNLEEPGRWFREMDLGSRSCVLDGTHTRRILLSRKLLPHLVGGEGSVGMGYIETGTGTGIVRGRCVEQDTFSIL